MMDVQQQRGRSPSIGPHAHASIRQSPSPHDFLDPNTSHTDHGGAHAAYSSQIYDHSLSPVDASVNHYNLSNPYLNVDTSQSASQSPFQPHVLPSNDFHDPTFGQAYQRTALDSTLQNDPSPVGTQQSDQQYHSDMLNVNSGLADFQPQQHPGFEKQESLHLDDSFLLDPQLQLQDHHHQQDQSINPADIMGDMSSPHNMHASPPSLMPPNAQSSEPTSPFSMAGHHWSPNHSRQASLDPSTAYTNGQQTDWTGLLQGSQFQGHRRAPSEHSDVSSIVAPSPYISHRESSDAFDQRSPMMPPQYDQQYTDVLNIDTFSLSDPQNPGASPRHSPFVSPMMSPQTQLGPAQDQQLMSALETQNGFNNHSNGEQYAPQPEQFPTFPPEYRLPSNDYGQADQLAPPEINVELAPNNHPRVSEPQAFQGDLDALTPPDRGRRGRIRAKSETYISRATTPGSTLDSLPSSASSSDQRGRSGSLSPYDASHAAPHFSRESSPAIRSPSQRRSSTSSIPNRDYILELADPSRPSAPGMEKRVQKHPATFQCHLCPKKFTRAYNLRSHLRTHTDERPFVCNVCSKAFARQHDRKRHEGLHSGEKKFVCKGELAQGGSWGCGRRFARADALGRHFRSEAGRVCIKPLLDEEALERQRTMDGQMMNQGMQMGGLAPQPSLNGMNQGAFTLPAALLQQYPALQGLQWDQLSGGPDDGDISGRSSYDASSGGDYYDEDDEGSGYMSDNPMTTGYEQGGDWQGNAAWKSDIEG